MTRTTAGSAPVRRIRRLAGPLVVAVLGPAAFLIAGVAGLRPAAEPGGAPVPVAAPAQHSGDLGDAIPALQERLRRLPGDHSAWATLGSLYLRQAQLTADPSYYAQAEGAFARSLDAEPTANAPALTGQAALAAARHDFSAARDLAAEAARVNPYSAPARAVLGDALLELGRYDEAFAAFDQVNSLQPGVSSYARTSYAFELRGELDAAREALQQARTSAFDPSDIAFAAHHLGELAFNAGDLDTADRHYADAVRHDPDSVPALAARARVAAAQGRTDEAVRGYTAVVERLPQAAYAVEFGELLLSLGRTEQAEEQFALVRAQRRLAEDAGVDVDLELALFEADHGDPAVAVAAAEAEWERRSSVHVADAYAWALHAAGRDREALDMARQAARLGTRSALFAYHRGMIEKSLGDDPAARASLAEALDINPHFSPLHAERARTALAELGHRP